MRQLYVFLAFCSGLLAFYLPGAAQAWQWATAAQGLTTQGPVSGQSFGIATVLDGAGNTVVAGNFSGTLLLGSFTLVSAGDRDIFVARFNQNGTCLQAVRAGGAGKDLALTVAVAANGAVVVGGSYGGRVGGNGSLSAQFGTYTLPTPAGQQEAYVARLSPAGIWGQPVRASGDGQGEITSLVLDSGGNALVGGYFSGTSYTFGTITLSNSTPATMTPEGFVARLSPTGTWLQAIPINGSDTDYVSAVALDASGNTLVGGTFYSPTLTLGTTTLTNHDASTGSTDIFVGRLSPTGSWLQATSVGGNLQEALAALVPEANGGLAVAVSYASPGIDFGGLALANSTVGANTASYDLAVARLNATGTWTQAVRAGGAGRDIAEDMSAEASGTLTVVGHFASPSISFGSLSLINSGPAATEDLFIARLSPAGNWLNVQSASGNSDEQALSVASSGGDGVVVSGYLGGTTIFGNTTVSPYNYGKLFVAHLASLSLPTTLPAARTALSLFPNPASNWVTLRLPAASEVRSVQLLDALGREVRHLTLSAGTDTLPFDLTGVSSGTYLVRCNSIVSRLVVE